MGIIPIEPTPLTGSLPRRTTTAVCPFYRKIHLEFHHNTRAQILHLSLRLHYLSASYVILDLTDVLEIIELSRVLCLLISSICTEVWALLRNSSMTTGTGALLFRSPITYLSITFTHLKHYTYTWVIMRVLEFSAVSTAILEYYPVVLSTAHWAQMCILQYCSPSAAYLHQEIWYFTRRYDISYMIWYFIW